MEFGNVYTRVCSWCCEIAIGTKNSSLIHWQVMFFNDSLASHVLQPWKVYNGKHFISTINVLERKLLVLSSHWEPPIYTKENGSNIPKAVFGSCKIFSGKYVFSGNVIFRKGKYFQVFGCIMKNFLENIFMCLGVFCKCYFPPQNTTTHTTTTTTKNQRSKGESKQSKSQERDR